MKVGHMVDGECYEICDCSCSMPIISSFAPLSFCKCMSSFIEPCEILKRSHAKDTWLTVDRLYCRSSTVSFDCMHSTGGHAFMYNIWSGSYAVV